LHDGGGILVLIIIDVFNVSNGIIEGRLGQVAGLFRIIEAFIMED